MVIVIKGIYNERATAQIATFAVLQLGKTAEEATSLIDERIGNVMRELSAFNKEIVVETDMISFVPTYEYGVDKKIFNPKTYNEKPSGFELKKNILIKFRNNNDFDKILSICGKNEIYDIAKVDYVTTNFDQVRSAMQKKALEVFKDQMANYSMIMSTDLNKKRKSFKKVSMLLIRWKAIEVTKLFRKPMPILIRKAKCTTSRKTPHNITIKRWLKTTTS